MPLDAAVVKDANQSKDRRHQNARTTPFEKRRGSANVEGSSPKTNAGSRTHLHVVSMPITPHVVSLLVGAEEGDIAREAGVELVIRREGRELGRVRRDQLRHCRGVEVDGGHRVGGVGLGKGQGKGRSSRGRSG